MLSFIIFISKIFTVVAWNIYLNTGNSTSSNGINNPLYLVNWTEDENISISDRVNIYHQWSDLCTQLISSSGSTSPADFRSKMTCYPGPPLYPKNNNSLPPIPTCHDIEDALANYVGETQDFLKEAEKSPTMLNTSDEAVLDVLAKADEQLRRLRDILPPGPASDTVQNLLQQTSALLSSNQLNTSVDFSILPVLDPPKNYSFRGFRDHRKHNNNTIKQSNNTEKFDWWNNTEHEDDTGNDTQIEKHWGPTGFQQGQAGGSMQSARVPYRPGIFSPGNRFGGNPYIPLMMNETASGDTGFHHEGNDNNETWFNFFNETDWVHDGNDSTVINNNITHWNRRRGGFRMHGGFRNISDFNQTNWNEFRSHLKNDTMDFSGDFNWTDTIDNMNETTWSNLKNHLRNRNIDHNGNWSHNMDNSTLDDFKSHVNDWFNNSMEGARAINASEQDLNNQSLNEMGGLLPSLHVSQDEVQEIEGELNLNGTSLSDVVNQLQNTTLSESAKAKLTGIYQKANQATGGALGNLKLNGSLPAVIQSVFSGNINKNTVAQGVQSVIAQFGTGAQSLGARALGALKTTMNS